MKPLRRVESALNISRVVSWIVNPKLQGSLQVSPFKYLCRKFDSVHAPVLHSQISQAQVRLKTQETLHGFQITLIQLLI